MKYAVALIALTVPAMLAAKAYCPIAREAQLKAGAAYSLSIWQISPLRADQIL